MKTNQKFFFDYDLGWKKISHKDSLIIYKGYLYNNNFSNIIKNIFKVKNKKNYIKKLDGLYAFVVKKKDKVIVAVDKISSIPIFFQIDKNQIIVSNKTTLIQKFKKNKVLKSSLTSFFMSGYTVGNSTIFEDIKRVEPGSFFESTKKKIFKMSKYYEFEPWKYKKNVNLKSLQKKYDKINLRVFQKIKNYCEYNNTGIAIALTAGYDSRLMIAMLNKLKFKNLICFTYGIKNNYELKAAKKISKFLNIQHIFVEINNSKLKKVYKSKKNKKFLKISEQGLSIVDTSEYVAISELSKKNIFKGRLILNGLSGDFITGGHQLEKFLDPTIDGVQQVSDAIIKKHFKLWEGKNNFINEKIIFSLLNKYFQKIKVKIKKKNNYGIIEHFDLYNRQSKYSLSRQQVYDYFHFKWLLPHFDREYLNFWQKIEPKYKTNQKFYDTFLRKKNYQGIWATPEWVKLRLKRPKPSSLQSYLFIPLLKLMFFYNKDKYHKYYKKYLDYFNQILAGYGEFSFFKEVINQKNTFRNFISLKVKKHINKISKQYKIKISN